MTCLHALAKALLGAGTRTFGSFGVSASFSGFSGTGCATGVKDLDNSGGSLGFCDLVLMPPAAVDVFGGAELEAVAAAEVSKPYYSSMTDSSYLLFRNFSASDMQLPNLEESIDPAVSPGKGQKCKPPL